jgi:hypothetical protein
VEVGAAGGAERAEPVDPAELEREADTAEGLEAGPDY